MCIENFEICFFYKQTKENVYNVLFLSVWSVDKLSNKIYDMRDAYQTTMETHPLQNGSPVVCAVRFFSFCSFYFLIWTRFFMTVPKQ